jgi:hypothetical protein
VPMVPMVTKALPRQTVAFNFEANKKHAGEDRPPLGPRSLPYYQSWGVTLLSIISVHRKNDFALCLRPSSPQQANPRPTGPTCPRPPRPPRSSPPPHPPRAQDPAPLSWPPTPPPQAPFPPHGSPWQRARLTSYHHPQGPHRSKRGAPGLCPHRGAPLRLPWR